MEIQIRLHLPSELPNNQSLKTNLENKIIQNFTDKQILTTLWPCWNRNAHTHTSYLIHNIGKKYFDTKLCYMLKNITENSEIFWNFYTKLIFFKDQ